MNQFTIEFRNSKDLAKKISEYNALMNPVNEGVEVPTASKEEVKNAFKEQTEKVEPVQEEPQPAVVDPVEETPEPVEVEEVQDPVEAGEVEPEIIEEPTPVEETSEVPITDFDGNVVDPETIEIEPVEETAEPFDPKAYWAEFRKWMGTDKGRATKAFKVFSDHGIMKPTSDALTDEIVKELNALMA